MTDIQERLMELMDDIDMICQKKNLKYVLFGRSAVIAKTYGGFPFDQYAFDIIMPLAHMIELMRYTEENLSETRAVESWYDNPDLKQMMFRFVDKKSTLIDYIGGHYYTKPGIAITIFVTRTQTFSGKVFGAERYVMQKIRTGGKLPYSVFKIKQMEKAWREDPEQAAITFNEPNIDKIVHNTGGLRWGYLRSLFMSDEQILRWVLAKNLAGGKNDGSANFYMTRAGGWHELPEDLFEDPERIPFEGRMLCNSKRYEEFMEKLYGEDWKDQNLCDYLSADRIRVIADCDLPYEEYMEFSRDKGRDWKVLMQEMNNFNTWKLWDYVWHEERITNTFAGIRRSVDRIDVWFKLRGKRKELKKAAEGKDIKKLRSILSEYLRKTDEYYDKQIGFMIDDELFSYAKMVWESEGKGDYADKVYELVPDLYKKESVEDYLKQKGVL